MSFIEIHSADNTQYKQLKKLATSSRERRKSGTTLLDGVHLIQALAASGNSPELLILREGSLESPEIESCLDLFSDVKTLVLSKKLFNELSPVETPVGILAVMSIPEAVEDDANFAVMLEDIQDPGNLGGILRTAVAAGVDKVYLSRGCAEAWSPKALRAGMGAQFNIVIAEQADLFKACNGYKTVVATQLGATTSLYDIYMHDSVAFLFGNEGQGLSPALTEVATHSVYIPMPGNVESLNVTAAAAICLFEKVRQQSVVIKET